MLAPDGQKSHRFPELKSHMLIVATACLMLIMVSVVTHYEVLRLLNACLPVMRIPNRSKLLVVMFAAFVAHGAEIAVYGLALFALVKYGAVGSLAGSAASSMANCFYFSAETYTTLGFGDLTPTGPLRLMAGVEGLNGLVLIGWSASYTYLAMERFWDAAQSNGNR